MQTNKIKFVEYSIVLRLFLTVMFRTIIDQMNRAVSVPITPKRIVSLVPSQTELLHELGCGNEVVGQTLFCIHPPEMHALKPRIGGTKNINIAKVHELQPDLIIGNKEENSKEQIEELAKMYPVWMSDIANLTDALAMINQIGELVNRQQLANQLASQIETSFEQLVTKHSPTVLYLIWRKPWMAAGSSTFIGDMLTRMGLHNVCSGVRYPELNDETIQQLNPSQVFLSSEPYPFKEKHIAELQQLLPTATITLVDGELFSWYGSRLMHSAAYFKKLNHAISMQSLDLPPQT